jgi:hypothetical protein
MNYKESVNKLQNNEGTIGTSKKKTGLGQSLLHNSK